jgi:hypothetical protein
MTGVNGLIIKGTGTTNNTWTIGEVKGPKSTSGNRLCFSLNNIPFACIDPASTTRNLVSADDPSL